VCGVGLELRVQMIVVVDEEKLPSDVEGRLKKRRDQ
jgi:hypothetical protein